MVSDVIVLWVLHYFEKYNRTGINIVFKIKNNKEFYVRNENGIKTTSMLAYNKNQNINHAININY